MKKTILLYGILGGVLIAALKLIEIEPLPVGLLIALVSAGILRRRRRASNGAAELNAV